MVVYCHMAGVYEMAVPAPLETKSISSPFSGGLERIEIREKLTPATLRALISLANRWRLTSAQAAGLLGIAERTWFRIKRDDWSGALSQDEMTRASLLIGIFKGLHLVFSETLADEWISLPNTGSLYSGRAPVNIMLEGGIPAMLTVRRHIDALRGGL